MKGTRSTIGLTIRANDIKTEDNCIIKCVKNSGMIPYMKTNLPQIALNYDSSNFLWGRTLNPWNQNKSAGGSSGGEAASIAARVSPIGIGNDMLGSIRIPASFNGVCGLMVSVGRLPTMNACRYHHFNVAFIAEDLVEWIQSKLLQVL
jgi:fatty acid amide hydrolase